MKILRFKEELCVGCHNCEEACASAYHKSTDIRLGALTIRENVDAHNDFKACDQCGECIKVCPTMAISQDKNGIVRIKKSDCVGCLMCVGFCDKMMYHDDKVEPFKCISCTICSNECPTNALYIETV